MPFKQVFYPHNTVVACKLGCLANAEISLGLLKVWQKFRDRKGSTWHLGKRKADRVEQVIRASHEIIFGVSGLLAVEAVFGNRDSLIVDGYPWLTEFLALHVSPPSRLAPYIFLFFF